MSYWCWLWHWTVMLSRNLWRIWPTIQSAINLGFEELLILIFVSGVRRSLEMIMRHMASTCLDVNTFYSAWTHFRSKAMIWVQFKNKRSIWSWRPTSTILCLNSFSGYALTMAPSSSTARVSLAEVFHLWVRWEVPGSGFEVVWLRWHRRLEIGDFAAPLGLRSKNMVFERLGA